MNDLEDQSPGSGRKRRQRLLYRIPVLGSWIRSRRGEIAPIPQPKATEGWRARRARRRSQKPRIKKLRVPAVLLGITVLAAVSWVFGVMMAVSQDLPALETREQFQDAENSIVTDRDGEQLAVLTSNERRILLESEEISPTVKQAVVAAEDRRFWSHRGVDYLGIARALREDILAGGAVQGGSTITQQFVKNALEAQDSRTVLQKLRESALAYHIERRWSKDKILTEYLNNIYFGEGAYGIEMAAQTYFGANHPGCGAELNRCASELAPEEAALLAALIPSPSRFSPRLNPVDSQARRNGVMAAMVEQGTLTQERYDELKDVSPPAASEIQPPSDESELPYFTGWLRQQLVDKFGAGQAFAGGLRVQSTIDLDTQRAIEQIGLNRTAGLGPTTSVVLLDNSDASVIAMTGGYDFEERPFNLATNGRRQPGSSFKPFTLVRALEDGISPNSTYTSRPKEIPFKNRVRRDNGTIKVFNELFKVNNYEDNYLGAASLVSATTLSDNSVYAELGTDLGADKVAATANDLGIDSNLGTNPALILGGLKNGVTPLELAYAYTTIANDGDRVSGTLGSRGNGEGPVAIKRIEDQNGDPVADDLGGSGANEVTRKRVIEQSTAETTRNILASVISKGTGKRAAVGEFAWGKTGTTDDNADAWFCGSTVKVTACVWVGHADKNVPMKTEFGGKPVDGGTIPALIWADVIKAYNTIAKADEAQRKAERQAQRDANQPPADGTAPGDAPSGAAPETGGETGQPDPTGEGPSGDGGDDTGGGGGGGGDTGGDGDTGGGGDGGG
ncbi:MAG: transglycosylase domain-containing protein, partial [Solirubrobacterales bacterium]